MGLTQKAVENLRKVLTNQEGGIISAETLGWVSFAVVIALAIKVIISAPLNTLNTKAQTSITEVTGSGY